MKIILPLPSLRAIRAPSKGYRVDTSFKHVAKYQNLLLSRDLGAMLCPFGGATGRIDSSTPFNSPASL